jgi:hypothetical protein
MQINVLKYEYINCDLSLKGRQDILPQTGAETDCSSPRKVDPVFPDEGDKEIPVLFMTLHQPSDWGILTPELNRLTLKERSQNNLHKRTSQK